MSGSMTIYISTEFGERIAIDRRMPASCDVAIAEQGRAIRYRRMSRSDLAGLLRAGKFTRQPKETR